jgi:hypothetical protein
MDILHLLMEIILELNEENRLLWKASYQNYELVIIIPDLIN